MKVLVVGSGGREHALCWKIKQSPLVKQLYCAPGNAGIAKVATCVEIQAENIGDLLSFARDKQIDLTVVGPEAPLADGIVDAFKANNLLVFGPTKAAARIEASKVFARELMSKHGIPGPQFSVHDSYTSAMNAIENSFSIPVVIKADGLAGGKGSFVCKTIEQAKEALQRILVKKEFGEASCRNVVLEEYVPGTEVSIIGIVAGSTIVMLEPSQDHKRLYDTDKGPNTGGMGTISPVPFIGLNTLRKIEEEVMVQTVHSMDRIGCQFNGCLYAGIMLTQRSFKVLEFNCRFGDPETQVLMTRIKDDIVPLLAGSARGHLEGNIQSIEFSDKAAVCIVASSGGYPGKYEKGFEITGLEAAEEMNDVFIFHAGTKLSDGKIVTNGGRVLGVTALGSDIADARARALKAIEAIKFRDMHYRKDIGVAAVEMAKKCGQVQHT